VQRFTDQALGQAPHIAVLSSSKVGNFVVGNDTGTAHVAAASGTPMVVICGPTDPRRVKPLGREVVTMQADLPCINCYFFSCDHHSCMRLITPKDVLARVQALAETELPVLEDGVVH
jgi:heptosyltransferase-2